jgi:phospholipid transport system substrate-binding protein
MVAVFAAVSALPSSGARGASDAGLFLLEFSDRAIAQLTVPEITEAEKEQRFRVLIDEGFDIPTIGKFVIGRYWRRANAAERQAFLTTFRDMMVYRFLPVFGEYSGERLKIGQVRPFSTGSNISNVSSELVRSQGEPVTVDWRVLHANGGYKIVDIIAVGVSIAVTLRSEYTSVLKNNGGDVGALTRVLRKKIGGG